MSDGLDVVRKVEEADISGLADLTVNEVYAHIDHLTDSRPGPLDLYRRWEKQNWSASDIDFTVDKQHWNFFDPYTKQSLEEFFAGFYVGEQAVTDTLAPLVHAAPDEPSRLFLSTQLVDEARHSFFFARFYEEVLESGSMQESLAKAKEWTYSTAYNTVFDVELVGLTDAVRQDPYDRGKWVEAVTLYHFMVEGILALVGQRMLLEVLRFNNILPGFRAGFTAVTRDESRHVSYAVWALSKAVAEGQADAITRTVDRCLEPCLRVYANPEYRIILPAGLPPEARVDHRNNWKFGIDSLTKRLRVAGLPADYLKQVEERGWKAVWAAVEEYEQRWGEDHPVRAFERGEISGPGGKVTLGRSRT